VNPTQHRQGIELLPHQLIESKVVSGACTRILCLVTPDLGGRPKYAAPIYSSEKSTSKHYGNLGKLGRGKGDRRMDSELCRCVGSRMEWQVGINSGGVHNLPNIFCSAAQARPPRQYEFPTGFNSYFGMERYQVGEQLFWYTPALVVCVPPALLYSIHAKLTNVPRLRIRTYRNTYQHWSLILFALVILNFAKFWWAMLFSRVVEVNFLVLQID